MTLRRWWLKAAAQGVLARLPGATHYNRLLQQRGTRSIALPERSVASKWDKAHRHLEHWSSWRPGRPAAVLELGTGWHPVVPVVLAVLGTARVWTYDQHALVSPRTLAQTLAAVLARCDARPSDRFDRERLATLRSLVASPARPSPPPAATLARLGIIAVHGDAARTGLPAGAIDLFVSNNTLEHVRPAALAEIFAEHRRIARPHALMSHYVDMKDHYAGFDPRIDVYHFLRFSDATWRLFDNALHHQNRLRVSDHRRLLERARWRVLEHEDQSDPVAFGRARLAPRFRAVAPHECMVYASWLVAELAPVQGA